MTDEDRLAELLLRWEELHEQGRDVSAEDLCQDCPHLAPELARRIHALKVTSWLLKPDDGGGEAPHEPVGPDGSPAQTLAGRYQLVRRIAEGGFAEVWQAFDSELQRAVAVKLPKRGRLVSAQHFLAEARRVARLRHPGVVPVFDVGRDGDTCFIVSEIVEGGSLADRIAQGRPTPQEAARLVAEVAETLAYAHRQGVIHRDIKPSNILIDHHGRALLTDFGIALAPKDADSGIVSFGTLDYMSPEQIDGRRVDHRSDLYSLGVVLYELLTGKLPYSSTEPKVLRREIVAGTAVAVMDSSVPPELNRICRRLLERAPASRYSSAEQLAADLRRFLAFTDRASSRWKRIGAGMGVLLLLGVGLAVWSQNLETAAPDSEGRGRPTATSNRPTTVEEALALGRQKFDGNCFEAAEEAYSEAIRLDPNNVEAYKRRGACKFNQGRFRDSLVDFTRALELDPNDAETWKNQALAHANLQQFAEAIADLEQGLKLRPADPTPLHDLLARIYSNRAAEHVRNRRFGEAAADVTEAIRHDPKNPIYYHQRGSCYYNIAEYEKAAADFAKAIELEPTKASHYLHRGYCLQALGKEGEARTDFKKAQELARGDECTDTPPAKSHCLNFLFHIGVKGSGDGQLHFPVGAAFDHAGNLYIADNANGRIQVFDREFTFLRNIVPENGLAYPHHLAVTEAGLLFVTEHGRHCVSVLDLEGKRLYSFGAMGNEPGQFDEPSGIAVDRSNNILVADKKNHRIQVFDLQGKFLRSLGQAGSDYGQFRFPQGLAVDSNGTLFVADHGNRRIQVFDSQGKFLRAFGTLPQASGLALGMEPYSVAVDNKGYLFVGDALHKSIQIFDSAGKNILVHCAVSQPGEEFHPLGIAVNQAGRVAVVNYARHRVQVYHFTCLQDLLRTTGP
jgi:tetratricopeptide (TPR) repeat protein